MNSDPTPSPCVQTTQVRSIQVPKPEGGPGTERALLLGAAIFGCLVIWSLHEPPCQPGGADEPFLESCEIMFQRSPASPSVIFSLYMDDEKVFGPLDGTSLQVRCRLRENPINAHHLAFDRPYTPTRPTTAFDRCSPSRATRPRTPCHVIPRPCAADFLTVSPSTVCAVAPTHSVRTVRGCRGWRSGRRRYWWRSTTSCAYTTLPRSDRMIKQR